MPRRPWSTPLTGEGGMRLVLLACLALLGALACGGESWSEALRYERGAIARGEWWRLLSGHWVHLGPRHLLPDVAGLVLLWALYARELPPRAWLLVTVCATSAIDAGLWWAEPGVQWYLGISGLLHGVWAAGAAVLAARGQRAGWIMLGILALKLALEQRSGASLVVAGFPVVTVAHLYGAAGGLVAVAALALARKPL